MSKTVYIHPKTPQPRLIQEVANSLDQGGVVICPTDSYYALICKLGDKTALKHIYALRQLDDNHQFTIFFENISQLAHYALVDDQAFKWIKSHTPGAYTFILRAESHTTRHLSFSKRKTIGARFSEHPIVQALLKTCDFQLVTVGLAEHRGDDYQPQAYTEIDEHLRNQVQIGIDAETCSGLPTSVIDLTEHTPEVLRVGSGPVDQF